MYRLVRAGVHAACPQIALVTIVPLMSLVPGGIRQRASSPDSLTTTAVAVDHRAAFALVDVLMAACVSMLRTRADIGSARHLATGFRRLSPRNPDRAAVALISQLLLASLGFVAIALRPPPDWFQSLAALLRGPALNFLFGRES